MSAEAIAIAGVGVALLAVLVPVVVLQSRRLEQRIDAVADALAGTRAELGEVRRDVHALAERVARIEGALTAPWHPTNGSPATAPKGAPRRPPPSDLPRPVRTIRAMEAAEGHALWEFGIPATALLLSTPAVVPSHVLGADAELNRECQRFPYN